MVRTANYFLTLPSFAIILASCGAPVVVGENMSNPLVVRSQPSISTAPEIVKKSTVFLDIAGYSLCSGTIVAKNKILTAKHCVDSITDASEIIVRFGPDQSDSRHSRRAYGSPRQHSRLDLAVISIEDIPSNYSPATIFDPSASLSVGSEVVIAGFGKTSSEAFNAGRYMRWGKTHFTAFQAQIDYVDGSSYRSILQFNARTADGTWDSKGSAVCGGDSGGPVYRFFNNQWGLTGVISGGPVVCESGISESLAADPRPNKSWILADLPPAQKCTISEVANVRYWSEESFIIGVLNPTVPIRVEVANSPDIGSRKHVTSTGYVYFSNTSCSEAGLAKCSGRIYVTDSNSVQGTVAGTNLRSEASSTSTLLGVIQEGTELNIIERRQDGWLKVDIRGTVDTSTIACR